MKTRTLAPGAYLARSGQGVSLYDAEGKCFAMNKMGGSILALALTGFPPRASPMRCAIISTALPLSPAMRWPPGSTKWKRAVSCIPSIPLALLPLVERAGKVCRILPLARTCLFVSCLSL